MTNSGLHAPLLLDVEGESRVRRSEEMVLTYRGWDAYERAHGGPSIVDFDLSSIQGSDSFSSRREVLHSLISLYDRFPEDSHEDEFLRARIRGSISYLRTLMGQQIEFQQYLSDTLGMRLEPFGEEEIQNARNEVRELLSPFGLTFDAKDKARYEREMLIRDPATIKNGIVGNQQRWLQRVASTGVPVPKQLPFSVQFTEVDAYWSNWISGSAQKGITLSINLHTRKKYDRGRPLALCLHEVCGHAVQMSIWRNLIIEGRISQACGLTTVHSPEMFVSEGLGQTVPDLLGRRWKFPAEFQLSRALQYYSLLVLHNAHLMIYEANPVDAVLDYVCDQLPFSDSETLEAEIRDRGTNPLFKVYQLSYAAGESGIRKLIAGMSTDQVERLFVQIYTKPMTPGQLMRLGAGILDNADQQTS